MTLLPAAIPYRVRFGVTGHRSLPDEPALLRCVLQVLNSRYTEAFDPKTREALLSATATPVVFSVVSPLAEGADRLVARAIMEQGGLLEAVLPMSRERYQEDFASSESRAEFGDLLARAHRLKVLEGSISATAPDFRAKAYRAVGEEVLERCDILIALWDGLPTRGIGGTAAIVSLALARQKPVFIISTSAPGRVELLNGGTLRAEFIDKIEAFNRFNAGNSDRDAQLGDTYREIFPSPGADQIPPEFKALVRDRLIPPYCHASQRAKLFQDWFNITGTQGYAFSTLSILVMALAVVFTKNPYISLPCTVLELVLLVILFEMVHRAEHERVHPGWLEHRALAERLRIAFYFVACGERPDTSAGGRSPLRADRTWMDRVYHEIIYSLPELSRPEEPRLRYYRDFITSEWVQGQVDYHRAKSEKEYGKNEQLKKLGKWSFILAIAVSLTHLWFLLKGAHGHHVEGLALMLEEALPIFAITLPAAGAAFNGYRSLMELSRIASRSKAMGKRLSQIAAESVAPDPAALRRYLERIEDTMLFESEDWLALMEHVELEKIA